MSPADTQYGRTYPSARRHPAGSMDEGPLKVSCSNALGPLQSRMRRSRLASRRGHQTGTAAPLLAQCQACGCASKLRAACGTPLRRRYPATATSISRLAVLVVGWTTARHRRGTNCPATTLRGRRRQDRRRTSAATCSAAYSQRPVGGQQSEAPQQPQCKQHSPQTTLSAASENPRPRPLVRTGCSLWLCLAGSSAPP